MRDRIVDFPQELLAAERRAIAGSIASGIASAALQAGDALPLFVLPDSDGNETSARGLLGAGPVVVVFLRGVWCPCSNASARAVEDIRGEVARLGASVVGISSQSAQHSRRMRRENGLGFPILVDAGGAIAAQFGVRWNVPDYLREGYERIGIDLTRFQGDGWTLPVTSFFVASRDGAITFAEVDPDFTRPLDVASILPVLSGSLARPAK